MSNELIVSDKAMESTRTGDICFPLWTAVSGVGLATLALAAGAETVRSPVSVHSVSDGTYIHQGNVNTDIELAGTMPSWRDEMAVETPSRTDLELAQELGRVARSMAEGAIDLEPQLRGIMVANRRRHYL